MLVAASFAWIAWLGVGSDYWATLLPAILVMALGMACAAAPLTNAVLSAVDSRHTGAASGLNSAVAQLGGLVATALVAGVLASRGTILIANARGALIWAGIAAVGAALSAFALVGAKPGLIAPDAP